MTFTTLKFNLITLISQLLLAPLTINIIASAEENSSKVYIGSVSAGAEIKSQSNEEFGITGGVVVTTDFFLSSMGICIHHAQGVPIQSYVAPLKYLGLKNIRDDFGPAAESYIYLHDVAGVKSNLITSTSSLENTISRLRMVAEAGALLSIEGPNEPNNFPIVYNGVTGGGFGLTSDWTQVAIFQRDLYSAVKSDDILKAYPVFGVSEVGAERPNVGLQFSKIPAYSGTTMPAGTEYSDYVNVHNYVSSNSNQYVDNQAWNAADPILKGSWDGLYINHGILWGNGYSGYTNDQLVYLPKVTTETGWDSKANIGGERVQGVVILNTYLSQFLRGWRYTFVYMLRDGEGGLGNQGVFNLDSTPKLSAQYIHNFTQILSDAGQPKVQNRFTYEIIGRKDTVHELLLQGGSGKFYLVIWNERVTGSDKINLKLTEKYNRIRIFDPTLGSVPVARYSDTDSITIDLSDHPNIIEIQ